MFLILNQFEPQTVLKISTISAIFSHFYAIKSTTITILSDYAVKGPISNKAQFLPPNTVLEPLKRPPDKPKVRLIRQF